MPSLPCPGMICQKNMPIIEQAYLAENGGYLLKGYGEVASKYTFTAKEPVRHPAR